MYEWIRWAGDDIRKENESLRNFIYQTIEERKQKIKSDESRIASLSQLIGIPQKRSNEEIIQHIKIDKKPLVRRIRPSSAVMEEYILDSEKVLDIIEFVDNQGLQFEKTPSSYKALGENALRDIILSTLNSIFAGSATGETFSHRGKTDIYLHIDKGNILIFECKFWGGQKLYHETIDQLLGYLTWRQNFGVIISFVRQKDFSRILSSAPSVVQSHESYGNSFKQIEKHHSCSIHTLPGDAKKDVEIHHLFYNLYAN